MTFTKRTATAFAFVAFAAFASAVATGRIYGSVPDVNNFYQVLDRVVSLPAWWNGNGIFNTGSQMQPPKQDMGAVNCQTFFQVLESRPELSKLRSLEGSLTPQLREQLIATGMGDRFTVFAPNDNAINNLDRATGEGANPQWRRNSNEASALIGYHVVPGVAATAASLSNGQFLYNGLMSNAQGAVVPPLLVARTAADVIIQGVGSEAAVVIADIPICRGVVHIIDQVLIPVELTGSSQEPSVRAQRDELQRILQLQPGAQAPAQAPRAFGKDMPQQP